MCYEEKYLWYFISGGGKNALSKFCVDISLSQAGPKTCVACKEGWLMDTEKGCQDVNECATDKSPCKRSQFCVNNDGSYTCLGEFVQTNK